MPEQKNEDQWGMPRRPGKIEVQLSGAEIQTSAVDTKISVWVCTADKKRSESNSKFSRKFGVVSAPALYKKPAVILQFGVTE